MSEALQEAEAPPATSEPCRHFGECGGCRIQDLPYAEQLRRKAEQLSAWLAAAGFTGTVPMHPSPQPWYYRNKMEFSFQDVYPAPAPGEPYLRLGLKRKNRWDKVMDLSECRLLSPETPALLESVRAWAMREGLEPYNLHKQTGFLRHLVLREGKNTGERMVLLVTGEGRLPAAGFAAAVRAVYPAATILRGVHAGKSDVAVSERIEVLEGPGFIHERLLGRLFRVSPHSFCQTNSRGAEVLYGLLRDWVAPLAPKRILDLYCGGGGISLTLSGLCERVLGVECVASAIEDARHNAVLQGVANAEFFAAKAEDILPGLAAQGVEVDLAVADPPRSGLHPAALAALKELAPSRLLYVSCNPKAMAEDIKRLGGHYDLVRVEGVDLFPHTDHMEAVALLRSAFA